MRIYTNIIANKLELDKVNAKKIFILVRVLRFRSIFLRLYRLFVNDVFVIVANHNWAQ